jgi:putative endopeptidase
MPRQRYLHHFALLLVLMLTFLPLSANAQSTPVASPVGSPVASGDAGIDLADMDLSVDPAVDFYRFANGGWLDRTEIPPDWPSYGNFESLGDLTEQQLIALMNRLVSDGGLAPGSDQEKAVRLWQQGLDLQTRNDQGITPIQPVLDEIDAITTLDQFHAFLIGSTFKGVSDLFNLTVTPDFADSSLNTVYLQGPFLGLPSVEYYTKDDPANEPARVAYREAVTAILVLAGMDQKEATTAAQDVYNFEASLAKQMVTQEEAQDISVIYNPTSVEDLAAAYPLLDWKAYLAALGLSDAPSIINSEKRLLEHLPEIIQQTPVETLRTYLKVRLLIGASGVLSEDFENATFSYNQALTGTEEQPPTEEEVLGAVNGLMGEAVGQLYVGEYFSPEAKAQVDQLVDNLVAAFRVRLDANPWLTPETKAKAIEKLDAMRRKIGYPDKWRSYAAVKVGDSYAQTVQNAANAETRRVLAQAGQPVDKDEWFIPPQVVNAFYNPSNNEIVFPAAILQPPFFDPNADPASNYGAIGWVIGHEITHGFDVQGSQFDADGNFANWWTPQDNEAFQALNDQVVAQYGKKEALPGILVNGQLTVGENVADLGGVQVAYDALTIALHDGGDPGTIDSFTQQQRFFIAASSAWRALIRPEFATTLVTSDPHAPSQLRGTLPLQNMDAFYEAFPIEPGDPMYLKPGERIIIW